MEVFGSEQFLMKSECMAMMLNLQQWAKKYGVELDLTPRGGYSPFHRFFRLSSFIEWVDVNSTRFFEKDEVPDKIKLIIYKFVRQYS